MKNVLQSKEKKWLFIIVGHYVEVQDFLSDIELLLKARLLFSQIEYALAVDTETEDDEADEVRATIHILVGSGNEREEVKKLRNTETYKWINIEHEGEVEENVDRDNVPNT